MSDSLESLMVTSLHHAEKLAPYR